MTDELKQLLKNAKTDGEAQKILKEHSGELTDDELEIISGGSGPEDHWFDDL